MSQHIAAIIPAYNEAQTIGEVVRIAKSSSRLSDVIVVSDGSTDQTASVARSAGAKVVELTSNKGKGEAVLKALSHTKAEVLLMLDADLRGLTTDHIDQLIDPVIAGETDMNVGLRDRGVVKTAITHHLPLISGERALQRTVIESVPNEQLSGYKIEIALNNTCRQNGWNYTATPLKGLTIRRKFEKVPVHKAVLQYIGMFSQVLWAMILVRISRSNRSQYVSRP